MKVLPKYGDIRILLLFLSLFMPFWLKAQTTEIKGTVVNSSGEVLPGATVQLQQTAHASITNASGLFSLEGIAAGVYVLQVRFVGYKTYRSKVSVGEEPLRLTIQLQEEIRQLQGITVMALRPDLQPEARMKDAELRASNARDEGEVMRQLQGVDAVRRGPLGLDPSVRGLREAQVGIYVDGARMFAAGPGRMDTPLSHYSPNDIQSIQVVKGPYALMWGPGNLSAVRAETQEIPTDSTGGLLHGQMRAGYNFNLNSWNTSAALMGRDGRLGYRIEGNYQNGDDYTSGNGTEVPAGFSAHGLRGKMEYAMRNHQKLSVAAGWQQQDHIEYAGRILNALFFHSYDANVHYTKTNTGQWIQRVEANLYANRIDHRMNNDGKPTAKPDPNRMPPFPLHVVVDTKSRTVGGSIMLHARPVNKYTLTMGANAYSNYRIAERHIRRADTGMLISADLAWPGATVSMGGVFARMEKELSESWNFSILLREDFIAIDADSVSTFFESNVSSNLNDQYITTSGAATLSYVPNAHWSYALGLGKATRSADATELYADRFPSSKMQMSAEFVGDPQLKPETSWQADLWASAGYQRFSMQANVFTRYMPTYITLAATTLPKRLPMSPNTVYQYTNGESLFYGGELSTNYQLASDWRLAVGASYLWGKDLTQDEPALGVAPLRTDWALRYAPAKANWFVEGRWRAVADQDRVASSRGETRTAGYYTLALKAGYTLANWQFFAGVENITDQQYVNHLNSKNPFTKMPVPEPGRVIYGKVSFSF